MEEAASLRARFHDVELVISCGDMPAPYLEYIVEILNVPLFFVRGNHDLDYGEGRPGGDNLHKRVVEYRGLVFAGLEGSARYNQGDVQYTQTEMAFMFYQMTPELLMRQARGQMIDVFVTHSPPWGIHDIPTDKAHQGFKPFLRMIQWFRPRYMVHGHVDVLDNRKTTVTKVGACQVININPVRVLTIDPLSQP
jgi:Icc-related predicted phosphoesterase